MPRSPHTATSTVHHGSYDTVNLTEAEGERPRLDARSDSARAFGAGSPFLPAERVPLSSFTEILNSTLIQELRFGAIAEFTFLRDSKPLVAPGDLVPSTICVSVRQMRPSGAGGRFLLLARMALHSLSTTLLLKHGQHLNKRHNAQAGIGLGPRLGFIP